MKERCEDLEERALVLLGVEVDLALYYAGDLTGFMSVMSYAKYSRKALTKLNKHIIQIYHVALGVFDKWFPASAVRFPWGSMTNGVEVSYCVYYSA